MTIDHTLFRDILRRRGLAKINLLIKFEVYTITCNEDIKGYAKISKNSHFVPPFGGLRGNAQVHL